MQQALDENKSGAMINHKTLFEEDREFNQGSS